MVMSLRSKWAAGKAVRAGLASKEGANGKSGEAAGKKPQLQERKSAFAEAAKRSVAACSAGRAGAHPLRRRNGSVLSFQGEFPYIELHVMLDSLANPPGWNAYASKGIADVF